VEVVAEPAADEVEGDEGENEERGDDQEHPDPAGHTGALVVPARERLVHVRIVCVAWGPGVYEIIRGGFHFQGRKRLRRMAFERTNTDESPIAAAPHTGDSSVPVTGKRAPPATGISSTL
jgi:hypothetical protein